MSFWKWHVAKETVVQVEEMLPQWTGACILPMNSAFILVVVKYLHKCSSLSSKEARVLSTAGINELSCVFHLHW